MGSLGPQSTSKDITIKSAMKPLHERTAPAKSSERRVLFSAETVQTDISDRCSILASRVKQYLDSLDDILTATDDLLSTKKGRKPFWSSRKYPEEARRSWSILARRSDRSLEDVFTVCLGMIRARDSEATVKQSGVEFEMDEMTDREKRERDNDAIRRARRGLEIGYPKTRFTVSQLGAASNLETTKERAWFVRKRAVDITKAIRSRLGDSVDGSSADVTGFGSSHRSTLSEYRLGELSISDLLDIRRLHRELIYAWRTEIGYMSTKFG